MAAQDEPQIRPTILPEEMADLLKAADAGGANAPGLIEQYRSRRVAWLIQADELARMRDEVRSSSEREAMEIVTKARRDVRGIVMDARRNLMVLSAQLEAALGENPQAPPSLQFPAETTNPADTTDDGGLAIFPGEVQGLLSEADMRGVLEDARVQMSALDAEVRTLPFVEGAAPRASEPPSPSADSVPLRPQPERERTKATSNTWMLWVGAPVLAATGAVLLLTVLVLDGRSTPTRAPERVGASTAASPTPDVPARAPSVALPPSVPSPPAPAEPESISVVIEALRDVWIRATVDGQPDAGRILEAGAQYTVNGEHTVGLRVGDAGAVTVAVNRSPPHLLGRDGEVVNRSFGVAPTSTPDSSASR